MFLGRSVAAGVRSNVARCSGQSDAALQSGWPFDLPSERFYDVSRVQCWNRALRCLPPAGSVGRDGPEQMRTERVASFGEQLRQARERRNISLQEISAATKIGLRALQALEAEHFEQLPGGIFNKGFVRAYARYVGLDEEEMLEAYRAAAKSDGAANELRTIADQVAARQTDSGLNGNVLIGVLALLVALGLGAVWFREHRREAREQAAAQLATQTQAEQSAQFPARQTETQPNAPPPPAAPQASPATQPPASSVAAPAPAAAPSRAAAAPGSQPAGPVEIAVTATQPTWISIRSDGKMVDSVLMDPQQPNLRTRTYKASDKLRMVVGNAGGIEVVSNGKPVGPLGKTGQTAIVTFTAQGMHIQQSASPQ
jgi:cytoskeleton protein RodZ